jgi:hypothetical protein
MALLPYSPYLWLDYDMINSWLNKFFKLIIVILILKSIFLVLLITYFQHLPHTQTASQIRSIRSKRQQTLIRALHIHGLITILTLDYHTHHIYGLHIHGLITMLTIFMALHIHGLSNYTSGFTYSWLVNSGLADQIHQVKASTNTDSGFTYSWLVKLHFGLYIFMAC